MSSKPDGAVFATRREPHTLIIARGDSIRHVTVRPWLSAAMGAAIAIGIAAYLGATAYLVLRDDLMSASVVRQARLQQSYEDRISALRTQLDRVTSRQALEQQAMEGKVTELVQRQEQLSQLHERIEPVLKRAAGAGIAPDPAAPPSTPDTLRGTPEQPSATGGADRLLQGITGSLRSIEIEQLAKLDGLTQDAFGAAEGIRVALAVAGLRLDDDGTTSAQGGPFIPVAADSAFDAKLRGLDEALDALENAKTEARSLPLASPATGISVSSMFGARKDPLLGTLAMHSGIDFRAGLGTPARATGAGRVVSAGWNGSYGKMIEIEHANGISSRYAHLSRVDVAAGDKVEAGDVIGATGNTGRSTGPHLHYEVRRQGEARDPSRFLNAGKAVTPFL